ncbi:MAG: hypothetical protein AAFV98_05185 [Chloroflexota bacterium]
MYNSNHFGRLLSILIENGQGVVLFALVSVGGIFLGFIHISSGETVEDVLLRIKNNMSIIKNSLGDIKEDIGLISNKLNDIGEKRLEYSEIIQRTSYRKKHNSFCQNFKKYNRTKNTIELRLTPYITENDEPKAIVYEHKTELQKIDTDLTDLLKEIITLQNNIDEEISNIDLFEIELEEQEMSVNKGRQNLADDSSQPTSTWLSNP